ncbi:MAG: radical SAM protein [bacterium]|nr:radical SAM protein [bacterium]
MKALNEIQLPPFPFFMPTRKLNPRMLNEENFTRLLPNNFGLYFHLPFCPRKCHFCNTAQVITRHIDTSAYVETILRHAEQAGRILNKNQKVRAISLGGGTPTAIGPRLLNHLLSETDRIFDLSTVLEATIESTVSEINSEILDVMKSNGFNRISLGIQTFNPMRTRYLNRLSNPDTVKEKIELIGKYGFELNVDLLYGLPEADPTLLIDDVKELVSIQAITGIELNGLDFEPNTVFAAKYKDYVPSREFEKKKLEAFIEAIDILLDNGFTWHTRNDMGRSAGNRYLYERYHQSEDSSIGFGSGVGGRIDDLFYYTKVDCNSYINNNTQDFYSSIFQINTHAPGEKSKERTFTRLMRGKLYLHHIDQDHTDYLLEKDLVILSGEELILTTKGRFYISNIAKRIIGDNMMI